ncbi:MAG: hypothetical protein ABI488_08815 [Polyangiaceae bacterium]
MPTLRFKIALLALAASSASCSVLIDTKKEQCSLDADCELLGAAFAGSVCRFNVCVKPSAGGSGAGGMSSGGDGGDSAAGDSAAGDNASGGSVLTPLGCPAVAASPTPTVKLSFSVSYAAAVPTLPEQFKILACKRLDAECGTPVGGPVLADNGALIDLEVPTGFQGFLQITNSQTVSVMVFLGAKAQQDTRFWDQTIPTEGDVTLLGIVTKTQIDPTLGGLIMIARDCERNPIAGVVASNSTGGTGYYFSAMSPDKTLKFTTDEGAAGFVNVPLGTAILGGTFEGRPLSPTSVESRAGWFSYAEVFQ